MIVCFANNFFENVVSMSASLLT